MNDTTTIEMLADRLPNEEIEGFYAELIENIAHDERSYGPTPFTTVLLSTQISMDNHPKRLYLSVLAQIADDEKDEAIHDVFHYFQDIVVTYFPHAFSNMFKNKDRSVIIQENDLPF